MRIRLLLPTFLVLLMSVLNGADYNLLKNISFVERKDLAGSGVPRTVKEPTTGIVIELAPGTTGTAYSMEKLPDGGYKWHLTGEISSIRRYFFPDTDNIQWPFCVQLRQESNADEGKNNSPEN